MTGPVMHTFDETQFCTRCGKARQIIADCHIPCVAPDNLIAISHIIAQRRADAIVVKAMAVCNRPSSLRIDDWRWLLGQE